MVQAAGRRTRSANHGGAANLELLLEKFLTTPTPQRLVACRIYREGQNSYWTIHHLEHFHWEFLYAQVSLALPPRTALAAYVSPGVAAIK